MEEIWRKIRGYNDYQVSNFGNVKNIKTIYCDLSDEVNIRSNDLQISFFDFIKRF